MDKILLDNMTGQEIKEMINNEVITLEELDNAALEKILNLEIDMLCFGSGDMALIDRCSEILNKRNDKELLDQEKVVSIINKTLEKHVIINNEQPKIKIKNKIVILRRIASIAAIITAVFATTTLVAAAFGVNIFEYISGIARQDEGAEMNINEFTFYNGGETKKYSTVEEMVKFENLNIMYPTKFPEGIQIKDVSLTKTANGLDCILISTNLVTVNIQIELNANDINSNSKNIYQYNEHTYYIDKGEFYLAACYYANNKYYISANTYEDLILIIHNMKE